MARSAPEPEFETSIRLMNKADQTLDGLINMASQQAYKCKLAARDGEVNNFGGLRQLYVLLMGKATEALIMVIDQRVDEMIADEPK